MRDIKIYTDDNGRNLDINIVGGEPEWLESEATGMDQRAALAAFIALGTIPGKLQSGVDWGSLYTGGATYTDISNQIMQQVQNYVTADNPAVSYFPFILPEGDNLGAMMIRI